VGLAVKFAMGDWLGGSVTVTVFVVESVAPLLSVTVSSTL